MLGSAYSVSLRVKIGRHFPGYLSADDELFLLMGGVIRSSRFINTGDCIVGARHCRETVCYVYMPVTVPLFTISVWVVCYENIILDNVAFFVSDMYFLCS